MKIYIKVTIIALTGLFFVTSCKKTEKTPPNQFTLEGEIQGLKSHFFFRHPDKEYTRETPPDTIHVVNGKIKFSDTISKLSLIRAYTDYEDKDNKIYKKAADGGYFPVKSMYLMFFAYPGAHIKIQGEAIDFIDAYPSGDAYNNSLAAINRLTFPNINESANLMVRATYEKDSVVIEQLQKKAEQIDEKGRQALIEHFREHPKSLGALWYLEDMIMRGQIEDTVAIDLFNNVSKELSDLSFYKTAETRIQGIKATAEGMPVPAVKTNATLDGSEFDIASLKGKYVLIDFWGIWCGPCVKEMPEVKAFQEQYEDQLVVLGINSGDTKDKIEKFIADNGYNWQQLMSDRENTPDNFVTRFNVKGFPTKFIIDPEGKIVKRYVGGGEEAFELLEELLN
ncbi:TlpA family protein disulfide reductase [Maribacter thermophilus]|uniref:TlpA family protein disulfide reductase n=1 Tax=Maribacter thermophilus TaxID=1197874 RepID=UPI00069A35D6|nr:TlpA disulfide reductase family protein [Maribacter thermophilus]